MSTAHRPLDTQAENLIIDRIANGLLPADSRLPSQL